MKNRFTALLYGLILVSAIANLNADSIYKSDEYGFSVKVPDDWRIHAEMNDPDEGRMIIDWGMPKVYSELEKTEIENAVSITAYKREEIKDIEDLMEFDFKRVEDITLAKSPVESMPGVSYQILTQQNMQTYSTNAVYYYENGIGYVIAFTATIGTYDMNHPQFRDFIKTIEFFEPSENRSPGSALPFDIGDTFPDSVAL
ncbi:MAG: hypothetical protein GWN00_33465, partial [Aliifodinibius sp.]|nr:hypothetical protein [candidate division Zixibacteria bacterium]NIT60939.1 hypothetical protein [Fodinibius sp.]NIW40031.1 hypothetical protein [candidate division Zixibacteria bacterium]NIX58917.1 hypothetical protein [candidate division Zixibacteria bacterium]NIY29520.1 hypothetical protein [Fodinibius sp.]